MQLLTCAKFVDCFKFASWILRPITLLALLAASLLAGPAGAQSSAAYPSRVVKIVVPYPAGSGPDQLARVLADHFRGTLRQSVIVDNKPGALGIVGTVDVARSAPDGYTILLTTNTTQAANVALVKNLQYDPIKDFTPIARISTAPMILLVRADSSAANVSDLMREAQSSAKPFSMGYGSAASLVAAAKVIAAGKLNVVNVPYKGIPAAVTDLLGGHVSFTFADLAVALPLVQSGRAKALGVSSPSRISQDPQIPALAETIPGFDVMGWQGLVAPAGTPEAAVQKLNDALAQALADPEFLARLKTIHQIVGHLPPKQFGEFIVTEIGRWKMEAKQAGLQPE